VVLFSIAAALVGSWIVGATFLAQAGGWFATEIAIELGGEPGGAVWLYVALLNAVAAAGPAALLWALAWRFAPEARGVIAAGRAWTIAALAGGLLGMVRVIPLALNEWLLLGTAVVAALLAGALHLLRPRPSPRLKSRRLGRRHETYGPEGGAAPRRVAGFGFAAGAVALLPWLWAGALGGLEETVLAVAAAAAFGWLAAGVLDGRFFAAYGRSRPWLVLVGGLSAGVALAPLAASVGGFGINLIGLTIVPALGFAAAAIVGSAPTTGPAAVTLLAGTAAVGPLAFVDPEETSLILGFNDVAKWAFLATLLAALAALAAGGVLGLSLSPRRWLSGWIPAATALVMVVAAGAVLAFAGRPGFYGDRLFVVLASQADLTGISEIEDRTQRLRATYERLVDHAERTQAPLREALDQWGLEYTPYCLVNAVLVEGGPAVRQWLSTRSEVDRVLLDQRLRPLPAPAPMERGSTAPPDSQPQWNISKVGADRVWAEFDVRGEGIVIGTSDSGVDGSHPALRDGFRGGDDSWYDPWNGSSTPVDHNGHGTHTLGTALGRGGIGVAPAAQWIGCVNLDRNLGSPSLYLECLQFMLAPFPLGGDPLRDGRPERAPHVLTNSWGCPSIEGCDLAALEPAVDAIRTAGIFMSVAAGNSGPGCGTISDPPAPYDSVFTVGAVDRSGAVTSFSSRGPTPDGLAKPDVMAPGEDILSALPGGTYGELAGTSMAAPHVAGVVALLWSAEPDLIGDIDATEALLRRTTAPVTPVASWEHSTSCGPGNVTGAGIVDAHAALREITD